jgi:licheninase
LPSATWLASLDLSGIQMSKTQTPLALFLLTLTACAPTVSTPAPEVASPADEDSTQKGSAIVLVDDFEDKNAISPLGGYWYTYIDQENGGRSTLEATKKYGALVMDGEGFESKHSLLVKYTLDQGTLPYPPYVGLGVSLQGKRKDLSRFSALQYTYRGGRHEVRIETENVQEWDFHAVQLPASEEWRTVTLDFSLFRQGGWGPKVPFALESTRALGWQLRGETGDTGSFQLDNVRLLEASKLPAKVASLEIHEPAPPEPATIDSLNISHPLQSVAMKSLNAGYNITNWLEEKPFDNYDTYNEDFVKRLAKAGFRALRLPIDLDQYVVKKSLEGANVRIEVSPDLFQILDNFDGWTKAHGLSLTIDYHQYDHSLDIESPESTGEAVAIWGKVAEHFKNNPRQDLFYELLNEPELSAKRGPSAEEWTRLSQRMITAIRAHDKKRPILFGDVRWYGLDELIARQPFADPNIIYVFHFYDPFLFTHQGAPWAGLGTTHDVPYPYDPARWSTHQEDLGFTEFNEPWQIGQLRSYYKTGNRVTLRNRLVKAKSWAIKHNVPLICNEFGVHRASSRKEDVIRYYTDVIELFEELEIPWQVWFMIMNPQTGEIDPEYRKAFQL